MSTVTKRRSTAWLGVFATAIIVASGLVSSPTTAEALSGADFDRGYIISDDAFYDRYALSEAEIQDFLDQKIGTCDNSNCLNIKRTDTFDRPADRNVCGQYSGAAGELASTILFKVQQACGISAKVLLVTLQKEQSLVTSKSPSDSRLSRAMGYGCPDNNGGVCDAEYYGLYNQIYNAAWQLKRYSTPTPWGAYQPGTKQIKFSPNAACGAQTVEIRNNATAALYNYTPYTPNAAALANLHGVGDTCSSYGNRNFWVFYNDWFGNPLVTIPQGVSVDRLAGPDRYLTSVEISNHNFAPSAPVVYVVTGDNYPDALSAAAAAAKSRAPLILVPTDSIPPDVRAEIQRLSPGTIVVVGGIGAISANVFNELSSLTPSIKRESGEDRYETSRVVAHDEFSQAGATTAFIATGENFPDALSASSAAGHLGAPVILVKGDDTSVDQEVKGLLAELGVNTVFIAGGSAVVSPGIESQLAALPGITSVKRLSGDDRGQTAAEINRNTFSTSSEVYVASGESFPDALSGAAVAGGKGAPLYIIPETCIPSYVLSAIISMGATKMTVLGGTGVIDMRVERFAQCR